MAAPMPRSPECSRRLFGGSPSAITDATPPLSSGSIGSSSSCGSVRSYSSSCSSTMSSGRKRRGKQRSYKLSSSAAAPATTRKAGAATTAKGAHVNNRPASPRVTKALFQDSMSSSEDDDEEEDVDNQSGGDDDELIRSSGHRDSISSNTSSTSNKDNHRTYRYQTRRSERLSMYAKDATTHHHTQKSTHRRPHSPSMRKHNLDDGDRSPLSSAPAKAKRSLAHSMTSTDAAASPSLSSPVVAPSATPYQLRYGPGVPIISPFVKSSEQDPAGQAAPKTARSAIIQSVILSPMNSPTTVKLSKNMTSSLTMKSPNQLQQETPHKTANSTPSRQVILGRNEILLKLAITDCQVDFGSPFEDLERLSWLGSGISAEVYKVRSLRNGELFAMKKSKNELRSERERSILMQEIRILEPLASSIAHFDHIVRYYQAWQEKGYLHLQMELCVGGTLKNFLTSQGKLDSSSKAVPEAYIWHILHDVVGGLDVLHRHGIVHLDIKPDNIFISEQGRFKVGDFGMATTTEGTIAPSAMTDLEGDGVYMAKELLSNRERRPSADIFCLGITLLEIATGITLPASGEEWHALRSGDVPPLGSEYSPELSLLITKMMHPDPMQRPTAKSLSEHPRVLDSAKSPPDSLLLKHIEQQKSDSLRDTVKLHRSTSFMRTPRKKRLSLS